MNESRPLSARRWRVPVPVPVLVSWSSGKDSAWALHVLRQQPDVWDVRGVFTTVTPRFDRVSVHGTPRWTLKQQAERLGLPLHEVAIPYPCSNDAYEHAMNAFLQRVRELPETLTARCLAYGDLFLEDVRRYREDRLAGTGFTPVFPIWGTATRDLADTMLEAGLRAVVTAVDPSLAPESLAGRFFDRALLAELPPAVDPLGENGEFHTCALEGPMFSSAVAARPGRVVRRPVARSAETDPDAPSPARFCVYADLEREQAAPLPPATTRPYGTSGRSWQKSTVLP